MIGFLAYALISNNLIWKSIIWNPTSGKTILLQILLIHVLSHFLMTYILLKLLFIMIGMFLLSCCSKIWKKLQRLFADILTSDNLKVVFTSPMYSKKLFASKKKLPKMLPLGLTYKYKYSDALGLTYKSKCSDWPLGLAYKYKCSDCNTSYYDKTKRHFKVQIFETIFYWKTDVLQFKNRFYVVMPQFVIIGPICNSCSNL